ncbi:hypothetical protein NDU88_003579 [Pleurodeles waltl]|uniref:Uncharacterized protein n=1 Tax=Pleurodeles waltl TaxID=8319 RepID=A0AAV7WPH3_PLEWA|nr:hypothetical protein NDU88_003579 [Pleurodeles waltl]
MTEIVEISAASCICPSSDKTEKEWGPAIGRNKNTGKNIGNNAGTAALTNSMEEREDPPPPADGTQQENIVSASGTGGGIEGVRGKTLVDNSSEAAQHQTYMLFSLAGSKDLSKVMDLIQRKKNITRYISVLTIQKRPE